MCLLDFSLHFFRHLASIYAIILVPPMFSCIKKEIDTHLRMRAYFIYIAEAIYIRKLIINLYICGIVSRIISIVQGFP